MTTFDADGNWHDDVSPMDGSDAADGDSRLRAALDDVHGFLRRFVAFPSQHDATASTLWVAHAHVVEHFDSTPRLAFLSPEPGSGKSRALEVIGTMVPAPMHAVNATPAALFRSVSDLKQRPTILFDEIDTVFGPKAKDNEEVRGFLNAGHRRGAVAYRCVGLGTNQTVMPFPAYCAVAVAGLNDLPDTITTRSVIVRMRRRAPTEYVEPFRFRLHEPEGNRIEQLLRDALTGVHLNIDPELPEGVSDRPADVWEPLLSIADAAGGDWPQRARAACMHHVTATPEPGSQSLSIRLLAELREVFGESIAVHTDDALAALHNLEEAPWADLRGRPLDPRRLSHMLGQYGVKPRDVKISGVVKRGYRRDDLWDAWTRYLPASPDKSTTSATSPTSAGQSGSTWDFASATSDDASATRYLPATERTHSEQRVSTGSGGSGLAPTGTGQPAACDICGEPMTVIEPGQTTHPTCQEDDE